MPNENRFDLAFYRTERAKECLKDAKFLLENESFRSAANRAYYAVFHAARAVMALDGEDRKKHSGIISYFQEHYVKTGIFENIYSNILQNAFIVRQESDYNDFYVISKEESEQQVKNAQKFLEAVDKYFSDMQSSENFCNNDLNE